MKMTEKKKLYEFKASLVVEGEIADKMTKAEAKKLALEEFYAAIDNKPTIVIKEVEE